MTLTYTKGDEAWVPVEPPDPARCRGAKWYEKTVTDSLTVRAGTTNYVGNDLHATFTIRWVADAASGEG